MTRQISRRACFIAVCFGVISTNFIWQANAVLAQSIQAEQVSESLTLFTGAGGNVLVHEASDSLILIDGGSAEHSALLLETLESHFDNKPISTLVNTHWHLDQTGSNDVLGATGVEIIAHENTRRWMTTSIEQHWGGRVFSPRNEVALPDHTFYVSDQLMHGNETIHFVYAPRAHTDGDIFVVFPDTNVIAAGGIAYSGSYPVLDTATNGWIGELLDATRSLLNNSDDNTIIVPAQGGVLTRQDLIVQEEMLATILDRFKRMSKQGKGADDMLEEGIADEYIESWGDPREFILTAWDGLWDHMSGLGAF